MARKSTDLVQVKLRIPEYLRRQVLAEVKKSGRSLNGELAHLIEEGLVKPIYESLITKAAEVASVEAAARMAGAITGALKEALKVTPDGLATLKAVAASTAASVPKPPPGIFVTLPSGREPCQPFSYSQEAPQQSASAEDNRGRYDQILRHVAAEISSCERALKGAAPRKRAEIQHTIETLKNLEQACRALSPQDAEK